MPMTRFITVLVAALLVCGEAWGKQWLYICEAKEIKTVGDDGKLTTDVWTEASLNVGYKVSLDTHSGVLRFGGNDPIKMSILFPGDDDNGLR